MRERGEGQGGAREKRNGERRRRSGEVKGREGGGGEGGEKQCMKGGDGVGEAEKMKTEKKEYNGEQQDSRRLKVRENGEVGRGK